MPDDECVMLAFRRFRIAGNFIVFRRIGKRFHASGQHLVDIALVRNVENDPVDRRVEDIVHGDCRLQNSEIRPDVPTVCAEFFQQNITQFAAKGVEFREGKLFDIRRRFDFFYIHFFLPLPSPCISGKCL